MTGIFHTDQVKVGDEVCVTITKNGYWVDNVNARIVRLHPKTNRVTVESSHWRFFRDGEYRVRHFSLNGGRVYKK